MPTSKCDIARDAMRAFVDGRCTTTTPAPECAAIGEAAQREAYWRTQYNPLSIVTADKRFVRVRTLQALELGLDARRRLLRAKYGPDVPEMTWRDFRGCAWDVEGGTYGLFNNRRIGRDDLALVGYRPSPVLGGRLLEGAFLVRPGTSPPISTSPIPMWPDRWIGPNPLLLLLIITLVVVTARVILRRGRPRPRAQARERVGA